MEGRQRLGLGEEFQPLLPPSFPPQSALAHIPLGQDPSPCDQFLKGRSSFNLLDQLAPRKRSNANNNPTPTLCFLPQKIRKSTDEQTNRRLSRRARLFPTPAIVTNSCLLRQQNRATLRRRSSREFDAFAQNRRAQNSKADCRCSFFPLPTHTSNSIGSSWQPPSPVLPAAQQKAYTASGVRHTHTLGALFFFFFFFNGWLCQLPTYPPTAFHSRKFKKTSLACGFLCSSQLYSVAPYLLEKCPTSLLTLLAISAFSAGNPFY